MGITTTYISRDDTAQGCDRSDSPGHFRAFPGISGGGEGPFWREVWVLGKKEFAGACEFDDIQTQAAEHRLFAHRMTGTYV